ncbi:PRC-barrel domain-containing protein [Chthonobacter albigriseus]|uniref:PRC-barrel domain-containing protein n=1 Tax=Chthonobacter albigriseus TaxID=1683161 RepID=UPI0015EF3C27|nr:PRC-barrel domain-containing protein [Chthonobacter albigriseus]
MNKTSVSILATVAFLAAGSAFAQDQNSTTTGQQVQPPAATDGAATGTDMNSGTGTAPSATTTTPTPSTDMPADTAQTPPASTDMPSDTAQTPPASTDMPADTAQTPPASTSTDTAATSSGMSGQPFVDMQQSGQWLASDLIGAKVRSSTDEDIGEVNDVLFTQDGQGEAIVVGVGGFLGIGEKNVAIPFERLTVNTEDGESDDLIVSLETTKEELNGAPAFRTTEDAESTMSSGSSEGVTPPTGATTPDATTPDATTGAGSTTGTSQ